MILLPSTSIHEAYKCAERIRKAIQKHSIDLPNQKEKIRITVSGGVACYPYDATEGQQLIQAADEELYKAKKTGRNKVVTKHPARRKKHMP